MYGVQREAGCSCERAVQIPLPRHRHNKSRGLELPANRLRTTARAPTGVPSSRELRWELRWQPVDGVGALCARARMPGTPGVSTVSLSRCKVPPQPPCFAVAPGTRRYSKLSLVSSALPPPLPPFPTRGSSPPADVVTGDTTAEAAQLSILKLEDGISRMVTLIHGTLHHTRSAPCHAWRLLPLVRTPLFSCDQALTWYRFRYPIRLGSPAWLGTPGDWRQGVYQHRNTNSSQTSAPQNKAQPLEL